MVTIAAVRALVGGGISRHIYFRKEALLGRRDKDPLYNVCVWTEDEEVELGIQDSLVGRRHARLFFDNGSLFVEDLGSRNGTFLDREPVPSSDRGRAGAAAIRPQ